MFVISAPPDLPAFAFDEGEENCEPTHILGDVATC